MNIIDNKNELHKYISKYHMNELFTKDMSSYMELFYYKKNEYLVKDSEKMNYLIFIVSGKAKAYMTLSNGKSLLLCFYQEFKVIGDLELLASKDAVTNVQAITDTYCIAISYDNARIHLLEDAKFLRFICTTLGDKLKQCSKNSSINILYSLDNRLASYIITAGERVTDSYGTKIIFDENLTQIAELLGTSYRHLLRTLSAFCQKGILKKENQYYEVIGEEELTRLSVDLYR